MVQELAPLEKEILRLRSLVKADPPAPKLMHNAYKEEMNEKQLEALENINRWGQELGKDSAVYLRFMKSTLDTEQFLDHIVAEATEVANEMRSYGPRPPPSLEEDHITEARAIGATALTFLIESLEVHRRKEPAASLRSEFGSELRRVEAAVALFKNVEDNDEGWHNPPSFQNVDQPLKPPEPPPPPPPPKKFQIARDLPGMRDGQSMTMRLHGVDWEDVLRNNELLLLEMCGDIIAEECKIPRHCVFNMSFSDPAKIAAEKATAEKAAAEEAAAAAEAEKTEALEKMQAIHDNAHTRHSDLTKQTEGNWKELGSSRRTAIVDKDP